MRSCRSGAVDEVLGQLDPTASIETRPMSRALGQALLPSRVGAAIGLYGGLLYSVSRRTREIGIRVALGATPARVLSVVCQHSFALVGMGMTIGLTIAFFASRPLAMFLVPGLSTYDPAAFLSVAGVLIGVALPATLAPAVRALRVDPATALRYE